MSGSRGTRGGPAAGLSGRERALGLAVVFAVLLLLAAFEAWRAIGYATTAADLSRRGAPAEATVVAVKDESIANWPGGIIRWTDVTVAFTDARGKPERATEPGADSTKVGQRLRIVYDPENPAHARWRTSENPEIVDWFDCVMCLLAALVLAWDLRRRHGRGT